MTNNDQSKLSIEELMEIAKHPLKDDGTKNLPPVKRFIVSYGIVAGDDLVPGAVIWDVYINWAHINQVPTLPITTFFQDFKLYFEHKKTNKGVQYRISQNGFDLSPENIALINSAHVASKRTSNGKKKNNPRKKRTKKNEPGFTEGGEESASET